jgi:DNA-binding NarL/FixJ family response regulator
MKLYISHFSHIMTDYLTQLAGKHELCNAYDAEVIVADDKVKILHKAKYLICTTDNEPAHIKALLDAGADEVLILPATQEIFREKLQLLAS